jgi:hypothetical protein
MEELMFVWYLNHESKSIPPVEASLARVLEQSRKSRDSHLQQAQRSAPNFQAL